MQGKTTKRMASCVLGKVSLPHHAKRIWGHGALAHTGTGTQRASLSLNLRLVYLRRLGNGPESPILWLQGPR